MKETPNCAAMDLDLFDLLKEADKQIGEIEANNLLFDQRHKIDTESLFVLEEQLANSIPKERVEALIDKVNTDKHINQSFYPLFRY